MDLAVVGERARRSRRSGPSARAASAKSATSASSSRVITVPTGFHGVLTRTAFAEGAAAASEAARPIANRPPLSVEATGTGRPPQRAMGES